MASSSPRADLIRLQKRLYRRNKAIIEDSVEVQEAGFRAYEQRYKRAVHTFQKTITDTTMLNIVQRADIVYVGDYHTCAQSQRSFLRLLKAMRALHTRPMLIGLELLHKRHQKKLDAYLAGTISEEAFLRAVGLVHHWVFDLWDNFRPIFDFARYHGIRIVGIDAASTRANLLERDRATGTLLATLAQQYSEHQLFVLIGDLHLAPQHLPHETQRMLQQRDCERRDVIVYQNSEAIYWRLAAEGREHRVSAVQIDARRVCRMHTSPIVCQQSYLNWLDHEEGEIDFSDAKHQFLEITEQIAAFLRVRLSDAKDDITVYTCGDLSFLEVLRHKKAFSDHELRIIERHVLASESYFIPAHRMVYLANLSMNHAAEEAAHYIKFLLCGPEQPRPSVDAFYTNVMHEALGFFGSKIINHRRKCFHEAEFRNLLHFFEGHGVPAERQLEYETAQLVLEYKKYERRGKPLQYKTIFHQSHDHFFSTTHALGYMLGDAMFYAVMAHSLRPSTVRKLFTNPWVREGDAFTTYMQLVQRLHKVKIPKRL